MGEASDMVAIGSGTLQGFATALLRAGGFTADQAEQTAAMLVWANLRGADFAWRAADSPLRRDGRTRADQSSR